MVDTQDVFEKKVAVIQRVRDTRSPVWVRVPGTPAFDVRWTRGHLMVRPAKSL